MAKVKAEDYVFPSTPSEAAKVRKEIDRIVNIMAEIDTLKFDMDDVAEGAEEQLQIPKALIKKYAAAKHDQSKFLKNKAILDEIAEALDLADAV